MNQKPLLHQALGSRWYHLAAPIRTHYDIGPESSPETCLKGTLTVEYPNFLAPAIYIIRLFGGLVDKRGSQINTVVRKSSCAASGQLNWQRRLEYDDGSIRSV